MRFRRIWRRRLETNGQATQKPARCDRLCPPVSVDVQAMSNAGMLELVEIEQCSVSVLERAEAFHVHPLALRPTKRQEKPLRPRRSVKRTSADLDRVVWREAVGRII